MIRLEIAESFESGSESLDEATTLYAQLEEQKLDHCAAKSRHLNDRTLSATT